MESITANRDVLISLKDRPLVQHNLLTMAPHDMSAAEKDIVYMILAQLENDDPLDKIYYIYIKDMEKLTSKELSYDQVHKATLRLIKRAYTIKEKKSILQVGVISSARYITGTGKIAIRIDPEIRPYLFGLKSDFTKYRFFMVMSLKSKYAKRLYEMFSQFKNTGIMRISIKELKERLCLFDPKSGKEKYTIWTMFKKKVLDVAEKEIKQYTDISFSYTVKKTCRTFTDLEFKINYKPRQLTLQYDDNNEHTSIYKRLTEKFRLSPWQSSLILEKVSEQEIGKVLYEIQLKNINNGLNNIGGFTAQTFENRYRLGLMGLNNTRCNGYHSGRQKDNQPDKYSRQDIDKPYQDVLSIGDHMKRLEANKPKAH